MGGGHENYLKNFYSINKTEIHSLIIEFSDKIDDNKNLIDAILESIGSNISQSNPNSRKLVKTLTEFTKNLQSCI